MSMSSQQTTRICRFLLDERRLSAGQQSFLISTIKRAERAPDRFEMSDRQEAFWETILDDHDRALVDAGLIEDWRKQ